MGGCDKTTPGLIMGATSMNLPSIYLPAGPMLRGNWRGETLGSGSDAWKYWAELRAGNIDECAWKEIEDGIARSAGTCMTMGTASTMTGDRRDAGADAARRRRRSRRSTRTTRAWHSDAAGASSRWCGGPQAARRADARGLRQRDERRYGARGVDQRAHAPGRDGGPGGCAAQARRFDLFSRTTPRASPTCGPPASI